MSVISIQICMQIGGWFGAVDREMNSGEIENGCWTLKLLVDAGIL